MTEQKDQAKTWTLAKWAFTCQIAENPVTAFLRSWLRILIIIWHEFFRSKISLRASALTFSIILSLVPMLAMSTAILKGLGSSDQLKTVAYRFIDQLDPPREPLIKPVENHLNSPASVRQELSLNSQLRKAVDTIFNYVNNTNFAALGAFGIAGLLITVVLVLSSVEDAMNAIWHTRQGRSLLRKTMDYLALVFLMPISINLALAGEAIFESPTIMGRISTVLPALWIMPMLLKLLPFLVITLSLMMMYLFFPHVRVNGWAAFWGALFGSISWFIVQRAYVVLQIGVAKYNAIYGSFATVPLFLVWIQLGWTFILLGAVLAFAIQNRNQYSLPGLVSTPQQSLQRGFDVLLTVYGNFASGKKTELDQLSLHCPGESKADLSSMVELLAGGGLIHKVEENGSFELMPSLPADRVTAAQVVRLVLGQNDQVTTSGGTLAEMIIKAAENAVAPSDFPAGYLIRDEQT